MNKLLTAILTSVLLFSFSAIIAQGVCGTSTQTQYDARERLFENRIYAANNPSATSRDATTYVPIRFHIVSKTDGTLGIKEQTILNLLCQINNEYADQDMVFYIFRNGDEPLFDRIDNTAFYEDPSSSAALNQISQNWSNKAINIYFTKTAGSNPNTLAYYLGPFPGFAKEHIICRNSSADGPTVAHELGHFFSLAHPFFGWENNAWDPNVHGNPVGTYAPAGAPFLNEKVDGSNCTIAADGLCDTPPDYLFAFSSGQSGCNPWTGGAMDPNGEICDPIENNMMSYFAPCSDYTFTDDQKEAIQNDYDSPQRNYIKNSYVPNEGPITETPELFEPIDNEITAGYNIVNFDWEEVPGAQYYMLEIDQVQLFNFEPQRFMVKNGTSKEVEDIFIPDATYFWRVLPFSDAYTCNLPISTIESFKTGESVSTKNIDAVNNWSVMPNPVRQNQILNIQIEANEAFDANIRLYSLTGKLIKNITRQQFGIGASNYEMNLSGVSTGMYIVAIQSEKGVINKKIVITN